jgi:hypothetical protein
MSAVQFLECLSSTTWRHPTSSICIKFETDGTGCWSWKEEKQETMIYRFYPDEYVQWKQFCGEMEVRIGGDKKEPETIWWCSFLLYLEPDASSTDLQTYDFAQQEDSTMVWMCLELTRQDEDTKWDENHCQPTMVFYAPLLRSKVNRLIQKSYRRKKQKK